MTVPAGSRPAAAGARRWWIDRRPVETVAAWVNLGVGLLFVALGTIGVATARSGAGDATTALINLVLGTTFLGLAALQVARPGPERGHVVVFRVITVALLVPPLAALVAVWLV
jgi:hypothetical protein